MPGWKSSRCKRGCLLALLGLGLEAACAAPYTPADDATVIERLSPHARGDALRRFAQAGEGARPPDPTVAVTMARRYIERSRAEADPRLLGYAQGLLAPWWSAPDAPTDVLLLRATLKQARHEFEGALADLAVVLSRRPDDAQAWLTRATVLRVQGRLGEAEDACVRLQRVAPGFASSLCVLGVRGLSGELSASIAAMQALRDPAARQDAAVQSWFEAEFADMLERAGRRDEAEARYRAALARDPNEPGLLAAYADFLLDDGRFEEASRLTAPLSRIDALRLRNAIARTRLGERPADDIAMLDAGFSAAQVRDEDVHLREQARFELEVRRNFASALDLAQRNWSVQREPWDARLLIAAAAAAGRSQEAQPARQWLRASKLEDARIPPIAGAAR